MKQDPYKLRVIALLIGVGFVGGLFVQYKAPGTFAFAKHAPEKKKGAAQADLAFENNGSEEAAPKGANLNAPPPSAAAAAEAAERKRREDMAQKAAEAEHRNAPPPQEPTPPTLARFAAISAIVDNTLEVAGPNGERRSVYFAGRGVVGDYGGARIDARLWTREGDRLCRSLGADSRECFTLSVRLNDDLRKGPPKDLPSRIAGLPEGALIGHVEGFGAQEAKLLRGNIRNFPGYVPLLEGKPAAEWTQGTQSQGTESQGPQTQGGQSGARGFVGALLLRQRKDEDRAATFFAPNGLLFEASRLARQTVALWVGGWRRKDDWVCRDLSPEESARAGGRAEECAHARMKGGRVEFAEADPARRSYLRARWPDEEPEQGGAQPAATDQTSFTDLR